MELGDIMRQDLYKEDQTGQWVIKKNGMKLPSQNLIKLQLIRKDARLTMMFGNQLGAR